MTLISSLGMWLSNSKGTVTIEWFGWQLSTSTSFFIFSLILLISLIYIFSSLIISFYGIPKKSLLNMKKRKMNNSINALNQGVIASFYGNKKGVLKNLHIAKKLLSNSPLLTLLELQGALYIGDKNNIFTILTKMLEIKELKPLAIKSLIAFSIKNKDRNLFKNMLDKSLDKGIEFSWIQKEVFKFCTQNNDWHELSNYLQKKLSLSNKTNKEMLSIVYFQTALEYYFAKETNSAKLYLKKAIRLNNFFPPFMELYCTLNLAKNKNELIRVLKKYWLVNPNPNIEKCIENGFKETDPLSKLKIISRILVKNNNLHYKYLILGKFKYKAKIWGSSKSDLQKSISFKPSKDAYYFLYKIEKDLKANERLTQKFKSLHDESINDIYWQCTACNLNYNNWQAYCSSCNTFNSIQNINTYNNYEANKKSQLIKSSSIL